MPFAPADGVQLYYEEVGSGSPLLFLHEFSGDLRGWEPQMRYFSRRHRCVAFNARGYPPSSVPETADAYSQEIATRDVLAMLDHLRIDCAHLVGLSMGAYTALHFSLQHPGRVRSLVVAGCGYGSEPRDSHAWMNQTEDLARRFESSVPDAATHTGHSAGRAIYGRKDPRGWAEFVSRLSEHSAVGMALTVRNIQAKRPSLYSLSEQLGALTVPTLIVVGDEDAPCLEPGIFMKRTIPEAGLTTLPHTGHTLNIEEPEQFNRAVQDFLLDVKTAADHGETSPDNT